MSDMLRRLYGEESSDKWFPDDSITRERRGMHEFVEGQYVNTPFGDIFVGQVRYPRDHAEGNVKLRALTAISDDWLSRWGHFSSPRAFDYRGTIFVDTETSGLAGAGGTIPFLIGIGYFYRNQFRVEQFFADSHSREEGMLDRVARFVDPFHTIVTFNGKAFDIPLLDTRYLLKHKESPFSRMDHLDLLHPSRQLWHLTLDNCRLQTLERQILNSHRQDDLPGAEIPQAYFNYIRFGDPDPLFRVFDHNAHDIASLVALTYVLWKETTNRRVSGDPVLDFSCGKILSRYGETERAIRCLESARMTERSPQRRATILSRLSLVYKSLGRWEKAESVWLEMAAGSTPFHLLPYVELAKYYEHRTKDLWRAREWVERAMSRLGPRRRQDVQELNHRLNRLRRRIEKTEGGKR
ncbi:MAG: ribonuclease H-like domain-containing protein [Fidelibacterota bacterium]